MAKTKPDGKPKKGDGAVDDKKNVPKFSSFKPKAAKKDNHASALNNSDNGSNKPKLSGKKSSEPKLGNHRVSKPNDSRKHKDRKPSKPADHVLTEAKKASQSLQAATLDLSSRPTLDRDLPMRPSGKPAKQEKYDRRRRPGFDYRDNISFESPDGRNKANHSGILRDAQHQPKNTTEPDFSRLRDWELFTIDTHGDFQNPVYGLSKWQVPQYRLYGGGSIVGLDPSIKIDFGLSTDRYYVLKYPAEGKVLGVHRVAKVETGVAMSDVEIEGAFAEEEGEEGGGDCEGGLGEYDGDDVAAGRDYVDMEMEEFQDPGMGMVTAK